MERVKREEGKKEEEIHEIYVSQKFLLQCKRLLSSTIIVIVSVHGRGYF